MVAKLSNITDKLNKALTLHQNGKIQEAEELYKQILKVQPENPDALHLLGLVCKHNNDFLNAEKFIQKAIKNSPSLNYFLSLADVYLAENKIEKAITAYKTVLNYQPSYAEVHNKLGFVLATNNRTNEGIECYKKAISLKPDYAEAYYNWGNALLSRNMFEDARNIYSTALSIKPDYTEVYYNIGASFHYENRIDEARLYYSKALELEPDYAQIYNNISSLYLLEKDFDNGWELYKLCRQIKEKLKNVPVSIIKRQWNGEPLQDKTIYVYHEQGIGDAIMSARYLPLLSSMGANILYKPHQSLEKLFKENDLKAKIIDNNVSEENIFFDYHVSSYYLLNVLCKNPINIYGAGGYLTSNSEKSEFYKNNYFNTNNYKIGLVWKAGYNDGRRSIPLELLMKLADIPNTKFYSLQKGDNGDELANIEKDIGMTDIGCTFEDFSDTAAAISNLDLVITVDTSVAHLAGAMGKPVWIMLPFSPDWRWFLGENDSPWYKSARLFRQKNSGHWDEVIQRVYDSLNTTIKNNM